MTRFCSQHDSVAAALRTGQWPDGCDPSLRAHVETCDSCSDLVLVAQTLRQAHATATQAARIAAPGILWWRAQLRRRQAAIQSMTRPVAVAEKVAVLTLVLAVVALVAWQHSQLMGWFANVWGPLSSIAQIPGALVIGLGTLLLFGGFAVYLFNAKE
ncbi:MAG TPA: hypothetical protein VI685_15810 [Candidatus Angelobacter sp.]